MARSANNDVGRRESNRHFVVDRGESSARGPALRWVCSCIHRGRATIFEENRIRSQVTSSTRLSFTAAGTPAPPQPQGHVQRLVEAVAHYQPAPVDVHLTPMHLQHAGGHLGQQRRGQ
jgi:hypothetical protein